MNASEQFDLNSMLIYSDPDLLIINKPAGLLSIQDGYNLTLPHIATVLQPVIGQIWMIHRLDKGTSGALIIGRNADAHRYFNKLFREQGIDKIYHAFVLGRPDWDEKIVDLPLKTNADRLHRTRVNYSSGKPAKTSFKVLQEFTGYTLLECNLYTGYTHQIRAHLFEMELPILGDTLYCKKSQIGAVKTIFNYDRLALHAYSIGFVHPATDQYMEFQADYPKELQQLLETC